MNAIVEPTRHRISIDDFLRMDAAGLFAPDALPTLAVSSEDLWPQPAG